MKSIARKYGTSSVASLCFGSNVAFLAFVTLAMILSVGPVENLFDVECDKEKQLWLKNAINTSFGERCVFSDMGDMGDTHAP